MKWTLYLLLCRDQTYYIGITTDLPSRIKTHNEGKGAKYTRGRGPVQLVWSKTGLTEGEARQKEIQMKKMTRSQKTVLIDRH